MEHNSCKYFNYYTSFRIYLHVYYIILLYYCIYIIIIYYFLQIYMIYMTNKLKWIIDNKQGK